MSNISNIDKNFKVNHTISNNIFFYNVFKIPCVINGVNWENGKFRRMPENVAHMVSDGVYKLHANTSGGRIRFKTNSQIIGVHATMGNIGRMPHFSLTGTCGFDLYVNKRYIKTFVPPLDINKSFESVIDLKTREMRDVVINMPLYSELEELSVGIERNSIISEPTPYSIEKPIVFYGSSITQGACASRPGISYPAIVAREFNSDFINMGFSGNAKGEDEIIDYICSIDMSLFVLDYDHNAPTIKHLQQTHKKMYRKVRNANPRLPIIIMCRPRFNIECEEKERCEIIMSTYKKALLQKDSNVYLITGEQLTAFCGNEGTVDNTHPNDLGFMSMARALIQTIKQNEIFKDSYK